MHNKDKFVGEFRHNKPNGNGCWEMQNGNKVGGRYT
jgi:hypothetical protein